MNNTDLLKFNEKLDELESRLESQESELSKIIYSKTFSILNQTDAENVTQDLVQREEETNKKLKKRPHLHVALKKHILEWMLVSTWSGPGIIIRVKNVIRKIYWSLIFLLCMAATIYVLVLTVNSYLQYGEVASITVMSDAPTIFPTVKYF